MSDIQIDNENSLVSTTSDFADIVKLIQSTRSKVFCSANKELINLYWQIGQTVSQKTVEDGWGKSTVEQLSEYIQEKDSELRGFSQSNLWRMKQFYETYKNNQKLSTLSREIPWKHNTMMRKFDKMKKIWYNIFNGTRSGACVIGRVFFFNKAGVRWQH
ncbi:MAG: DUF1016 N-terminal domain-containing protein [Candidatus Ancillula sp.]|jgi:predicted nuclease of restriction endonuclease-like (RecB) superfamily|nr:DUF1016 N-terminal domain-containing protein [Candidatus Ancillula sp.]